MTLGDIRDVGVDGAGPAQERIVLQFADPASNPIRRQRLGSRPLLRGPLFQRVVDRVTGTPYLIPSLGVPGTPYMTIVDSYVWCPRN